MEILSWLLKCAPGNTGMPGAVNAISIRPSICHCGIETVALLWTDFERGPGRISYHIPRHLRVQSKGQRRAETASVDVDPDGYGL
jgi:hypothetical protein